MHGATVSWKSLFDVIEGLRKRPFLHRHWCKRGECGQSIVEFALIFPILIGLVFGIVDFGMLFTSDIEVTNAVRDAARYTTVHPTAWTNADPAASDTIEGQLQQAGGTAWIPNDDSHMTIAYYVGGSSSSPTECGYYSAASNAFVSMNGYSQSTCVIPGSLIQVDASYTYTFFTPLLDKLFPSGVTVTSQAMMLEET